MISWIRDSLEKDDIIDFITLESYRGFLVYISRTYPFITPYLKGIHLTLDSWRPWRNDEAWKLPLSEIKAALDAKSTGTTSGVDADGKPPSKVKVAPRLYYEDVQALEEPLAQINSQKLYIYLVMLMPQVLGLEVHL